MADLFTVGLSPEAEKWFGETAQRVDALLTRLEAMVFPKEEAEPKFEVIDDSPLPDDDELPFDIEPKEETKEEPKLTVEDLRKKAVTLSAAGKKDKVREIVKKYADRVTDLPEDKYEEVWKAFSKLEG